VEIETEDISFIDYCVDRLLRINKVYLTENWTIVTCDGYYGQEVESIKLNCFDDLVQDIKQLIEFEPNKRIEFILEKEYQFLTDIVKNKNWKEVVVLTDKLKVGNNEYLKKIDFCVYDENHELPIGIYVKDGEFYRLIDGYHRFCGIVPNKKEVSIIFGE
jgi:hypothetical protein